MGGQFNEVKQMLDKPHRTVRTYIGTRAYLLTSQIVLLVGC